MGVAALVSAISETLASRFGAVTVRGEIQQFTRASSGHCYLTLKDADDGSAMIRCAMFRRAASMLDFAPREGLMVDVRGRVAVYEPRGELQFVIEAMRRAGDGSLYERFMQLKARLEAEGLFDPARKRDLPAFPRVVGVVTSPGAAALHDVLTALARRAPHVRVVVYPSLVQGQLAPAALVDALALANARREVDVLILCRGGGSLEDLWAFNDERVVRAVRGSALPIVCGVGHETDVTLCDFAADLRAPTPTAAAELAAPTQADCLNELAQWARRMRRHVHAALERHAQRIDRYSLRLARPGDRLRRHAESLASLRHRLQMAWRRDIAREGEGLRRLAARLVQGGGHARLRERHRLERIEARLSALDPRGVLSRGYAWVGDESGHAITSAARVQGGQLLKIELADGAVDTRVEQVRLSSGATSRS